MEVGFGELVVVLWSPFFVVALDATEVFAVPDIHRNAESGGHAVAFVFGARIGVDSASVGFFEDRVGVPGAVVGVLGEVERVDLGVDESGFGVLSEAVVPDAPVDHGEVSFFEMHDDFGGPVVWDVDPDRAGGFEGADAEVDPVVGELGVFAFGHGAVVPNAIGFGVGCFVLVVVSVPVERGVGEDEINRRFLDLGDLGELGAAVTDPDARGRAGVEGDCFGGLCWWHR